MLNCTRAQEHSIPDPAPVVMRRRNAVSGNVIKEEDATNYVKKVRIEGGKRAGLCFLYLCLSVYVFARMCAWCLGLFSMCACMRMYLHVCVRGVWGYSHKKRCHKNANVGVSLLCFW